VDAVKGAYRSPRAVLRRFEAMLDAESRRPLPARAWGAIALRCHVAARAVAGTAQHTRLLDRAAEAFGRARRRAWREEHPPSSRD